MAVVRVASVPCPVCVVVSLLLLLVLLIFTKEKRNPYVAQPYCVFDYLHPFVYIRAKVRQYVDFLLCRPCPLAPPLSKTPSWGRESGSLRTHWRKNAKQCSSTRL